MKKQQKNRQKINSQKTDHFIFTDLNHSGSSIGRRRLRSAASSVEKQMMESAEGNVQILNNMIDDRIGMFTKSSAYFSEWATSAKFKEKNLTEMQERFKQFIESNDKASAVFSSGKEGTFTRYPHADMPADFNPLERSWYQEAMENKGQTIITDPYESISNKRWSSPWPARRKTDQASSPLI